jgi:hypothetical protein
MAETVEQPEEDFPVFELGYFDSLTGGPSHVRSSRGKLFLRMANGGSFRWINLRIASSAIPLKLKYKCRYKRSDGEADIVEEAIEGEKCPREDAAYIKQITFESKIYFRCWLSRDGRPEEFERDPAGAFWYYNGQFCGTQEDNRWITALEIKMPPLGGAGRAA